jgi:hypothetical protein
MTMTSEATGWLLTGFTLTKEAQTSSSDDDSRGEDTVTTGEVTP